jgi:hypothetical protein
MFFYSADGEEPRHVHVEREDSAAKFWLGPVRFESSRGFSRAELRRIEDIIEENEPYLVRTWNEYFGN